ncbi:hypothetical protein D1007_36772 [Hordeum vulgare]|nr:hypothetical protein D1007_36772 [Hordeum vulgare]
METRLEAMEQQVFKCQGMVEHGLNANHTMDATEIGKHLSRLYNRVDQLQGQIYDLQNQNYKCLVDNPLACAFPQGTRDKDQSSPLNQASTEVMS